MERWSVGAYKLLDCYFSMIPEESTLQTQAVARCLPEERADATCSAMKTKLITIDPEIMSGEPVFTGTRVPVRNLIDYLSAGHTLNDFLEGFPGVKRSQAIAFLEQSSSALLEQTGTRRKAA